MNRAWEPKPCRHCGGFCGDSGPTCDERYDAVWGGAKTVEAGPNTDSGLDAVIRHRLFVYEVDFGDEGKGRYIRLSDFNKVVADYDAACEPFVRNNSSEEFINIRVPTSAVTKLRAMLAAAPSASGGESAASVSERARELLAAQFPQNDTRREALLLGRNVGDPAIRRALRALEQALTQQRGENPWKDAVLDALANTAMDAPIGTDPSAIVDMVIAWHERLSTNPPDAPAMRITIIQKGDAQAIREWHNDAELPAGTYSLFTTPQPSADAVRELVKRWRDRALDPTNRGFDNACSKCADELESLLSAASDHQQNAAQGGEK